MKNTLNTNLYKIEHSNTDVRKLWNLADNKVIARKTVENIFKNNVDGYIVFNSKQTYDTFKRFEYSTLALFNKNGE